MKRGAPSLGWIAKVLAIPEGGGEASGASTHQEPLSGSLDAHPLQEPDLQRAAQDAVAQRTEYLSDPLASARPSLHPLPTAPSPAAPESLSLQVAPPLPQASPPGAA
jgi:hypothetical protein